MNDYTNSAASLQATPLLNRPQHYEAGEYECHYTCAEHETDSEDVEGLFVEDVFECRYLSVHLEEELRLGRELFRLRHVSREVRSLLDDVVGGGNLVHGLQHLEVGQVVGADDHPVTVH